MTDYKRTKEELIKDTIDCIRAYNGRWGKYDSIHEVEEKFVKKNVEGFFGTDSNNPETLHIVLRGSDDGDPKTKKDDWDDWKQNFKFKKELLVVPYENMNENIKVHKGFIENWKAIRDIVFEKIKKGNYKKIIIKGHSAGAGTGTIGAVDIQYNFFKNDYKSVINIPIASPRVGNFAFKKSYNKRVPITIRIVNGEDYVTKIPLAKWGYRHIGKLLHIGFYNPFCRIPVIRLFGLFYHLPESYLKNLKKCKAIL